MDDEIFKLMIDEKHRDLIDTINESDIQAIKKIIDLMEEVIKLKRNKKDGYNKNE